MASGYILDVWEWINNLPPFPQWTTNSVSLSICSATNPSQPSIKFSITKTQTPQYITFSISADYQIPISLWTSTSFPFKPKTSPPKLIARFFLNILDAVLSYGPTKKPSSFRSPTIQISDEFGDVFNVAFLTLAFIVCVYEAPRDLRSECLDALKHQLSSSRAREASRRLVRVLGSNLEEQWVRSLNLAITNRIVELQVSGQLAFRTPPAPASLFSYAVAASGLWKVQLYCPVIAMNVEDPSVYTQDERLMFSLKYQQLEGVIQLGYRLVFRENWIDVVVGVDNVRCDVSPLVSNNLMDERGYGSEEKHFPSRVSLRLTPTLQTDVLSVSVSKSSDNPTHEVGLEKTIEGSFDPPNSFLGFNFAASESVTMSMKPWKFEQSVYGDSAYLNWFLHDGVNGREVFSSKPPKLALFQPRAWFRDRYSSAYRPFTKQGGVIFAGDEYGESVCWKLCGGALGKSMEWEIKGCIWVTYWPNKQRTFYSETRRLEFRELLQLQIGK